MFAITGVTGKVGGAVARSLLAQGHKVRAVVRDAEKGRSWSAQGCDIEIASVEDAESLTKAFDGTEGVFLMTPPNFDPKSGLSQTHKSLRRFHHLHERCRIVEAACWAPFKGSVLKTPQGPECHCAHFAAIHLSE
jgi:putative NADH-flavin reductase